jgi:hypothetical protein
MKTRPVLFVFALLTTTAFSQQPTDVPRKMSREENQAWLSQLKEAAPTLQLNLVKQRFFSETNTDQSTNPETPLLIIDGIVLSESQKNKRREFFKSEITAEKILISILDKAPDTFCKPFSGMIVITITDEKTSKHFSQIN